MNQLIVISSEYFFMVLVLVGGLYFIFQPLRIKKKMLVLSFVSLVLTLLGMFLLHFAYVSPRPDVVGDFTPFFAKHFSQNGFPSSHTTLMILIACVMYVFNRKIGVVLFCIALLSAISRVYLGLHHTIDIVAGILLAVLVTILAKNLIHHFVLARYRE